MRKGPIAKKSMSVAKKQRMASSGVQAIGSPLTLKDVLMMMGVPESFPKLSIN